MNELKPCPFCGGKAELLIVPGNITKWIVRCTKCYTNNGMFVLDHDAIKVWNRRVKSKYKPENEIFHVGDEVINNDSCETAYVLAPDYGETEFVLLLEGYTHPQYVRKQGWKKTGQNSHEIIKQVELAAKALQEEGK